jgi:hypothetical protein
VERLALNQAEAAEALGMSVNSFKRYVRPYVRRVECGGRMVFPVGELQKYLDMHQGKP